MNKHEIPAVEQNEFAGILRDLADAVEATSLPLVLELIRTANRFSPERAARFMRIACKLAERTIEETVTMKQLEAFAFHFRDLPQKISSRGDIVYPVEGTQFDPVAEVADLEAKKLRMSESAKLCLLSDFYAQEHKLTPSEMAEIVVIKATGSWSEQSQKMLFTIANNAGYQFPKGGHAVAFFRGLAKRRFLSFEVSELVFRHTPITLAGIHYLLKIGLDEKGLILATTTLNGNRQHFVEGVGYVFLNALSTPTE